MTNRLGFRGHGPSQAVRSVLAIALLGSGCQLLGQAARKGGLEPPQTPSLPAAAEGSKSATSVATAAVPARSRSFSGGHYRSDNSPEEGHRVADACSAYRAKRPAGDQSVAQKIAETTVEYVMTCADRPPMARIGWTLDALEATGEASEMMRTGYVISCLYPERYEDEGSKPLSVARQYLVCGYDGRTLDAKRFEAELAARNVPPYLQQIARARFSEVHDLAVKLAADYAALGPEYTQVLVDAPEKAFRGWKAVQAAHREAFADIRAFEAAFATGAKSKVAGCRERLRRHFDGLVSELKPRTPEDVTALATGPLGGPLLGAMGACDAVEARYTIAYQKLVMSKEGLDGPRAAALAAARAALDRVRKDQSRFPVVLDENWMVPQPAEDDADYPRAQAALLLTSKTLFRGGDASGNDKRQTEPASIASTSVSGEYLRVKFTPVKKRVPETACRSTDRVKSVSNGRVEYQQECWQTGRFEIVDVTLPDVLVRKELASGLAKGNAVKVAIDEQNEVGGVAEAFPLQVLQGPANKKPIADHGIALR